MKTCGVYQEAGDVLFQEIVKRSMLKAGMKSCGVVVLSKYGHGRGLCFGVSFLNLDVKTGRLNLGNCHHV
jgi:hypothetical protein